MNSRLYKLETDYGAGLSLASPKDYFALLKPRVMALVIFTAWVGLYVAPGDMSWAGRFACLLSIALGAGASAALNMWYDADIDSQMWRTCTRPLPQNKIAPNVALGLGVFLSVFAVWALSVASHLLAASLLAFTIFFYAVIYTMWLKRRTPQNIVIGGVAGAFPPLIGWVAVSGRIDLEAILLFLIIFIWTPPHFWALSLYKRGDYQRAAIPMLPNVRGAATTRFYIMAYSLGLVLVAALPFWTRLGDMVYMLVSSVFGLIFLALALAVLRSRAGEEPESDQAVLVGNCQARRLFAFSILYLFVIFSALALQGFLQTLSA